MRAGSRWGQAPGGGSAGEARVRRAPRGGGPLEGKGFAVGLALVAVVLAVVFGLTVSSGATDDLSGDDCYEESC